LILFRYLKISKRVEHTFVYNRFRPVEKLERELDPGFKLFKNEPSSIYGIISWIVLPVIAVIAIVVVILAIMVARF
jgi:hypothetical protein